MVATGAPATYAAAPTMTSMYATPGASMYMPAQTVAAAPMTYAAPQQVVETVAAPQTVYAAPAQMEYAAPQQVVAASAQQLAYAAQFTIPAPVSLTQGLVPPDKVEAERLAYEKALQSQLSKQSEAVLAEAKIKKQMMEMTAKTQLEEMDLQIKEKLTMDKLRVDQEAQTMINGLKEAAITQQTAREEAAAIAVAEYSKKKALEDMAVKSYQLQKQWFDSESKLQTEYQATMKKASQLGISNFNV